MGQAVGRGQGRGLGKVVLSDKGTIARVAAYRDSAVFSTPPFTENDHGPLGEHVGNCRRLDVVCIEAAEIDGDSGEYGRGDVFAEFCRNIRRLVGLGYDERFALADPGEAFDQVAVDRRADAEGEQIAMPKIAPHELEGLGFDVDVAVRYDRDGARDIFALGQGQGSLERGKKFGTTAATLLLQEIDGGADIFRCGGQRSG